MSVKSNLMKHITKRRRLVIYKLTLVSSGLVSGGLAILIIGAINHLDIHQWAKGVIFLAIGVVSLAIYKAMSKNIKEARKQILTGGR